MNILGIDPGLKGGYAYVDDHSVVAKVFPLAGKDVDLRALSLEWAALRPDMAILEKVGAMPGQGVTSMFSFGKRVGEIRGILATLGISYAEVRPQVWKGLVLAGTEKDKDAAIAWCRKMYPSVSLVPAGFRTAQSGIADALCMAVYGRIAYRA